MKTLEINPKGKKIYFASDFHLGVPNLNESHKRERKIVKWLDSIKKDASHVFLLGDVFDFWFEYKKVVPRGYIRILGKLAELSDSGIQIVLFHGNHDMWMFDYLKREMGAMIFANPIRLNVGKTNMMVGHGDGLGPGDFTYKVLRKIFRNRLCQYLFGLLPPRLGMGIAETWSKNSRIAHGENIAFDEESEFLLHYCRKMEEKEHFDYYIFGHRHLVVDYQLNPSSKYLNLGEWVTNSSYAVWDGGEVSIKEFL